MIRLIFAPDSLASLDLCLEEIARHSRDWPLRRAFLLVPEEAKADSERRYLECFDQAGLMMAEVLSFQRLAHRIFSEAGGLAVKRLSSFGQAMLICRALQEKQDQFRGLRRFAGRIACAESLRQVQGDFRRYGVDASALREAAAACGTVLTRDKLLDLAQLFQSCEEAKAAGGWTDADEDLSRLSRLLKEEKELPALNFLRQTSVWVAGFAGMRAFTPQELELLQALSLWVPSLLITLSLATAGDGTGDDAHAQTAAAARSARPIHLQGHSYARVSAAASASGENAAVSGVGLRDLMQEELLEDAYLAGAASLKQLRGCFPGATMESLPDRRVGASHLTLLRFQDAEEELIWTGGEIRRLLKEEGYRRRDLAVALCDSSKEDRLRSVFLEFGLDPFISWPRPLEESRLFRYLDVFFRIAAGEEKAELIIDLARTGLCGADSLDIDRFANFLSAAGVRYLRQLDGEAVYRRREAEAPFMRAFYQTFFRATVAEARVLSKLGSGAEQCRLLGGWLCERSGIKEILEQEIERLSQEGDADGALFQARAWESCLTALEDADDILGEAKIAGEDFGDMLLAGLRGNRPGSIPIGLDRIRVASVAQLLLYPCKVLFIIGADSRHFPPAAPAEGFLLNSEREWLEEKSGIRLPNYRRETVRQAAHLLWNLPLRPTERLYLSSPSEESGRLSRLQEQWEILAAEGAVRGGIKISCLRPGESGRPDPRWLSARRALRLLCGSNPSEAGSWGEGALETPPQDSRENPQKDPRESQEEPQRTPQTLPQNPQIWRLALEKVHPELCASRAFRLSDPLDGREAELSLNDEQAARMMGRIERLSISRLQSFNACPYRHFVERGLLLQEPILYAPDSRGRGSLMHGLAEQAFGDLMERMNSGVEAVETVYRNWREGIDESYCLELYDRVCALPDFAAWREGRFGGGEGLRLRRYFEASLRVYAEQIHPEAYMPVKLEWRFPEDGREALLLRGLRNSYQLHGVIDRVDLDREGHFRIYDYKSGNARPEPEALLYGLNLQLPIYALAWNLAHPAQTASVLALQYFDLPEAEKRDLFLPPDEGRGRGSLDLDFPLGEGAEDIALFSRYAYHKAGESIRRMEGGEIRPSPCSLDRSPSPCEFCDYGVLCRDDARLRSRRQQVMTLMGRQPETGRRSRADAAQRIKETMRELLGERDRGEISPEEERTEAARETPEGREAT